MEHITEFASAGDHAKTLRKWQELNIALTTPPKERNANSRWNDAAYGAFEETIDSTNPEAAGQDHRWKFKGPYLLSQSEAEFQEYVKMQISKRRPEFREFVRKYKAEKDSKAVEKKATEAGEGAPAPVDPKSISEEDLRLFMRSLRQDRAQLFKIIGQFLDLPPAPAYSEASTVAESLFNDITTGALWSKKLGEAGAVEESQSPYAKTGPPLTHPSAGLSYLRSNAYTPNHPFYGPQADPEPVEARVILPKNAAVGSFAAKLGVAGVVTDVPSSSDYFHTSTYGMRKGRRGDMLPGLINIEPEKVGGSKVMVKAESAIIDPKGTIKLKVVAASPESVSVKKGVVDTVAPQSPVDGGIPKAFNRGGDGSRRLSFGQKE
jgi:hypothetical protein